MTIIKREREREYKPYVSQSKVPVQVRGRKLVILYPPSDAKYLDIIPGEVETVQSAVDPLLSQSEVNKRHPQHVNASPR